jgi:hypothetical protein
MKNLKTLRGEKLLKSKSYGITPDEGTLEYFWALTNDSYIVNELGYVPPKAEVNNNKRKHEWGLGNLFVSLMLADLVVTWIMHKRLGKDFIPDRTWDSEIGIIYIEHETGSQNISVWRQKILNYLKHFREAKEQFHLLFTMPDEASVTNVVKLFEELKCSSHYYAAVHSDLVENPLNTLITNRFTTKKISDLLSITESIT